LDDGPNPEYTLPILGVLARYDGNATFFLVGQAVESQEALAREIVEAGHAVGNHTFTHRCLADCNPTTVVRELSQCQRAIREATGVRARAMRPPYGRHDAASVLTARLMGYWVVNWFASGGDWRGDRASAVVGRVAGDTQPGGIVLLHDGCGDLYRQEQGLSGPHLISDRSATIEALPMIIGHLQDEGYRLVTIPEMARIGPLCSRSRFAGFSATLARGATRG